MPAWLQAVMDFFINNWTAILKALIVIVFGFIIIKIIIKVTKKAVGKSKKLGKMVGDFLVSVLKIALYVVYLIIVLSILGVPTDSFVALLTTLSLAISLAVQDSLSNFAGGFIITTTRPFEEGDFVDIDGTCGSIKEITITNTKLTTPDNKVIVIPNSKVSSAVITNYSRQTERRVDWTFNVAYGTDVEKVKTTLLRVLRNHPLVIKEGDQAPLARLNAHGSNCLEFVARAWTKSDDYWTVFFDVNETIVKEFAMENIEIPFNQMYSTKK